MPFVVAKDGTEIFYRDLGTGSPVVLIHGWPLSGDSWDKRANFSLNMDCGSSIMTGAVLAGPDSRGTDTTVTRWPRTSTR